MPGWTLDKLREVERITGDRQKDGRWQVKVHVPGWKGTMTYNKPNGSTFFALTRKEVRSFAKFVAQLLGKQFVLQLCGKGRRDHCTYIEEHHWNKMHRGLNKQRPNVTPE